MLNQFTQFTDKVPIFAGLSVKPGPKRLNFYGQTAVFDHFVRNRLFSSRPFTDRRPIFPRCVRKRQLFCQMQCLINQRAKLSFKFAVKLFWVISIMEGDRPAYKKPDQICN